MPIQVKKRDKLMKERGLSLISNPMKIEMYQRNKPIITVPIRPRIIIVRRESLFMSIIDMCAVAAKTVYRT